ncbi:MAG: DnaJ domain-containing protein [Chloroflexi bacterium]|nr:DnaJ domain-containing protein [Chloroflexota bacterium]
MADYYKTLGVARGASEKDIRGAFRKLARKHHPDVNDNDPASEEKFKEINEAYTVLSDADSRRKYDRYGDEWKHADQFEQSSRGRRGRSTYSTMGGGGGRSSIFDQFFGGMGGFDVKPAPAEYKVAISLEEAFKGAARRLQMQDGRRLEVKIPPGVDNGSRVHIAADSGDFYLVVSVKDHPKFRRQGKDLYVEVEAPLDDAVLGGELTVPTLTGRLALTIPKGTQNGRRFRLAGQGMPVLNNSANHPRSDVDHRGDLFATLKVKLPSDLTEEEIDLFRMLRDKRMRPPEPENGGNVSEEDEGTGKE